MTKPDLMAELAEVVRSVAEYEAHERETPESCSDHEDAPHGFDCNGSHNEDRYVCECEHWEPDAATNVPIARKAIDFLRTHHAELEAMARDAEAYRKLVAGIDAEQLVAASEKHGDAMFVLRDAERYRWLRDECTWALTGGADSTRLSFWTHGVSLAAIGPGADEFDHAIDYAMHNSAREGL